MPSSTYSWLDVMSIKVEPSAAVDASIPVSFSYLIFEIMPFSLV